jgi:16S rRNA (uracil1498-N3)-methyltransferase
VQTTFTNSERIRRDRLQAHAIEAAEQCGGTYVPVVDALQKLKAVLDQWPEDRSLLFCDETKAGAGHFIRCARTGALRHFNRSGRRV